MRLGNLFSFYKPKTIIFVLGCQRSGTTMLENVLEQISKFSVYGEGSKKAMRVDAYYRFRDEETIRGLISRDRKRFILFRPLNDAQYTDRYLKLYPNSKAIWIYRRYPDTINSAVKKWGEIQKNIIIWIRNEAGKEKLMTEVEHLLYSIYSERIHPETLAVISKIANDSMTKEEGAALIWYIRNQIYFDLNLQQNNKVLLVKYEDAVTEPETNFKRIFEFIGIKTRKTYADNIFSSSIGKNPAPVINPRIENICMGLMEKLDSLYSNQLKGVLPSYQ